MNVLDLFSGIGGFSLGLERAGMRTVAFCEASAHARAVLRKHWPNVPCYEDVRTLSADRLKSDGIGVDVICGGFPCQDISDAGKRAGIAGERSGLWTEYARLIGELRPRYVIVENVAALLGRGLDVVLGDLAALGFDAEWHCIPASAVGAPHRRDRIWIVAHSNQPGQRPESRTGSGSDSQQARDNPRRRRADVADAQRRRLQGGDVQRAWAPAIIPAAFGRYCGGGDFGAPWRIEPNVGRVAYGVPAGMDRIERLGNAVLPQIPEILGGAIMTHALSSQHHNTGE